MDVIDLIGKIPEESIMYGEKSHKYLQEMYRECFEGREAFTVGETSFATPVSAPLYSDKERKELTMVFGFEHLGLEEVKGNGKWDLKPLDVNELKQVFLVWQKALHEKDGTACSGLIMTSPELFPEWAMTRFTGKKAQKCWE